MERHALGTAWVVIAAALTLQVLHVDAYNILMIPLPGRSHLFSMAAMAEGLAIRGHWVSLLVGENFPADNLPEVRNWSTAITLVRYVQALRQGELKFIHNYHVTSWRWLRGRIV